MRANARSSSTSSSGPDGSATQTSTETRNAAVPSAARSWSSSPRDGRVHDRAPLERVDHRGLPAVLVLGLVGLELRRALHHLRAGHQLGAVVQIVRRQRPHRRMQGDDRRLLRGPLGEDAEEGAAAIVGVGEEHVLLGGEVAEERARRHLAGLRDLLDRGAVEALAGEQHHGRVLQGLAGAGLLAFSQADRRSDMMTILTHNGGWQQLQLAGLRYLAVAARMVAAWRC